VSGLHLAGPRKGTGRVVLRSAAYMHSGWRRMCSKSLSHHRRCFSSIFSYIFHIIIHIDKSSPSNKTRPHYNKPLHVLMW